MLLLLLMKLETADQEMVDHAADDGSRSPGLSLMLHIASPPDRSTLFSDIGYSLVGTFQRHAR